MMLPALVDLARREGLLDEPDFQTSRVDFFLHFDGKGKFTSLVPTVGADGLAKEIEVPLLTKRTGTRPTPQFLFDNAKYVLGLDAEGKVTAKSKGAAAAFRELLATVAESTGDEAMRAATRFLDRLETERPRILRERPPQDWTGSEWIALVCDDVGKGPIHLRPAARREWKRRRALAPEGGESVVRCLVTGTVGPPALTHPNIKRIPGAQTSGAALVSFNCDAFESHGLAQGENAPMSRAAAEGYVTALNWLLAGTPSRIHRYGVRLGDDAVMVFWTREQNQAPDLVAALLEPSPEDASKLLESPLRGIPTENTDETAFYAATLSGNAARVVVRDWFQTTAAEAKGRLNAYFQDLRIGNGVAKPIPVWLLLSALTPRSGKGLAPAAASNLLTAALRGRPFSRELLVAALRRLRLPPDEREGPDRLRLRCAVVKAVLVRTTRAGTGKVEVPVALDESKKDVPYLLGRLFAVLERLQGVAQGDINASIRDRWFGSASMTPAVAFPRLLRLSVHHASKAERGGWLEKLKGQILAALPADGFPKSLDLEAQGLFAVGYYHQRERFFERRAEVAESPDVA